MDPVLDSDQQPIHQGDEVYIHGNGDGPDHGLVDDFEVRADGIWVCVWTGGGLRTWHKPEDLAVA